MFAQRTLFRQLTAGTVLTEPIHLHSYARDAGFYRLVPRMVVKARSIQDIAALFKFATEQKRNVVFRAGGTSLSGQSVGDDILVEVKQGWRDFKILEGGRAIQLQPGVVAATANQYLERLGTRIGPDPGSIRSALMGGIVANNASGIGSGTHANSYQTLKAMEMVLTNGLILNTANPQDDEKLYHQAPRIYEGLLNIRERILRDKQLRDRIVAKYAVKNTVGYGLNSFLDFDRPIEILAHLMVGSEGTLGFISKVTLATVALQPCKATALLEFGSLTDAASLVPGLKRLGVYACEILDDAALKTVTDKTNQGAESEQIVARGAAALLIEFQSHDQENLATSVENARSLILKKFPDRVITFFSDPEQRERLWKIRRELGPLHAAQRPPGTTLLSEDVCFQVKDLARAIKDLQFLFKRYHYEDAFIFGHAGDGNLHFKLSLDLSTPKTIAQYGEFMQDLVTLVTDKYNGSLKAEHGTGRNMAPFVAAEWGADAYAIMQEIKRLLDPQGILNPDVILSNDPQIHLKYIKAIPLVDPLIDTCIECGLCEPWCPSADLSLTARQRITVLRELETLKADVRNTETVDSITRAYQYQGVDTCAADGLCGLACPMDIDTGLLMKQHRLQTHGPMARNLSHLIRKHYAETLSGLRLLLLFLTPVRSWFKADFIRWFNLLANRWTGHRIPQFNRYLRAAPWRLPPLGGAEKADFIYFPSCINRGVAGDSEGKGSLQQAFTRVAAAAGIKLAYPRQVKDLCCGLTFSSKGFLDAAQQAAIQTTQALWVSSQAGRIPIVMDTSPCSVHLQHYDQMLTGIHLARWRSLRILDMVTFLHDHVLAKLELRQVADRVILHPTCSDRKLGNQQKMEAIARACARQVIIPMDLGCCGFAGDRGLSHPELTRSATRAEAQEVITLKGQDHYSTSRMCEVGISLTSGKEYRSLIYLLDAALQEKTGIRGEKQ